MSRNIMDEMLESINDSKEKCINQTKQEFSNVLQNLTDLNDMFLQFFKHVIPQSHKKDLGTHVLVTMIISVRSFRLLQNCVEPFTSGYYESGMILIRSIYENNMLLSYLKDKEDAAEKWLLGKNSFTQEFLRNQAGVENTQYKFLSSRFAHPNEVIGTFTSFSFGENTLDLNIFPKFIHDGALGLYYCLITGSTALELMKEVFEKENLLSDEINKIYEKFISDMITLLKAHLSKTKEE